MLRLWNAKRAVNEQEGNSAIRTFATTALACAVKGGAQRRGLLLHAQHQLVGIPQRRRRLCEDRVHARDVLGRGGEVP